MNETVTITKAEYTHLLRCNRKLDALERGGVDNWEWYDASLEDFRAEEALREADAAQDRKRV